MRIEKNLVSSRSITFTLEDAGKYELNQKVQLFLNGNLVKNLELVTNSIFDLKPDTTYHMEIKTDDEVYAETVFTTLEEFVTLNVRDFGAKGDGLTDDTLCIQAAIMACPPKSRVLIPRGTYRIKNIFLKSHIRVEISNGAELLAETNRELFSILPGVIQSYDEGSEYNLGTWEGNPLDCFAGIITGLHVEDVILYGEGVINGNAGKTNWWHQPKVRNIAFRPRLLFLNHCENVVVQGIQLKNSPSWVVHPYFSNHLKFLNVSITNPSDSPNTDGIDPESCGDVEILGVHFSLGDDCIAIKSGKIYMGAKHKTPSKNLRIRHCLMENGHGAVTLGSEMSGGICDVLVEECVFRNTDRGLRLKTRRGRGKDAIIDQIVFRDIQMESVKTPFVMNSFYFCDPDGKSEYVQSREVKAVDERTPEIKKVFFENINCVDCHAAVAYFEGLPEKKIEEISIINMKASFAKNPIREVPAMTEHVYACIRQGIFVSNVKMLKLRNIKITGHEGEEIVTKHVDDIQINE